MSSININCPHCHKANRIASHQFKHEITCQYCNKNILKGVVSELLPHNFLPLTSAKQPLVLFISGPNCSKCKSFSMIFSAYAKQQNSELIFSEAYLPNNKALANKLKLRGVPAIAIFKNSKIRGLVNGGMRKGELTKFINDSLS